MTLRDVGAYIKGSVLMVPCIGKDENGNQHCSGRIRIPLGTTAGCWAIATGSTIDDISLKDSVNAGSCGHFNINAGEITVHAK